MIAKPNLIIALRMIAKSNESFADASFGSYVMGCVYTGKATG